MIIVICGEERDGILPVLFHRSIELRKQHRDGCELGLDDTPISDNRSERRGERKRKEESRGRDTQTGEDAERGRIRITDFERER
eukprot:861469-Amorphochlora_amoeboformis.AAC.1